MSMGDRIAGEALALVGVPFRLHGRSETMGLDCVGLAVLATQRAGEHIGKLPAYRLRGMSLAGVEAALRSTGFAPVEDVAPGDILVAASGPMQLHLMVRSERGLVHADAGLRRVVIMPPPSPWPILGQWRLVSVSSKG